MNVLGTFALGQQQTTGSFCVRFLSFNAEKGYMILLESFIEKNCLWLCLGCQKKQMPDVPHLLFRLHLHWDVVTYAYNLWSMVCTCVHPKKHSCGATCICSGCNVCVQYIHTGVHTDCTLPKQICPGGCDMCIQFIYTGICTDHNFSARFGKLAQFFQNSLPWKLRVAMFYSYSKKYACWHQFWNWM